MKDIWHSAMAGAWTLTFILLVAGVMKAESFPLYLASVAGCVVAAGLLLHHLRAFFQKGDQP